VVLGAFDGGALWNWGAGGISAHRFMHLLPPPSSLNAASCAQIWQGLPLSRLPVRELRGRLRAAAAGRAVADVDGQCAALL
jgi:hypothetical protein